MSESFYATVMYRQALKQLLHQVVCMYIGGEGPESLIHVGTASQGMSCGQFGAGGVSKLGKPRAN